MGLFGKTTVDPKVQVDEWTKTCRQSCRDMDRQVRNVQREEEKAKRSLRDAAKKGDRDVCKILATEIVRSRRTVNKIQLAKVQVNSLILSMRHQLATLRVAGSLQKSTEVMTAIQSLIKLPEINKIMQDMAKEMMRAGIIEEMMDDAMDAVTDEEGLEEEADSEVEKVLWELTEGKLGEAPRAVADSLPSTSVSTRVPAGAKAARTPALVDPHAEGDDEEDLETMRKRLDHLKS